MSPVNRQPYPETRKKLVTNKKFKIIRTSNFFSGPSKKQLNNCHHQISNGSLARNQQHSSIITYFHYNRMGGSNTQYIVVAHEIDQFKVLRVPTTASKERTVKVSHFNLLNTTQLTAGDNSTGDHNQVNQRDIHGNPFQPVQNAMQLFIGWHMSLDLHFIIR